MNGVAEELRLAADRHLLYSSKPGAMDDLLRRAATEIDALRDIINQIAPSFRWELFYKELKK